MSTQARIYKRMNKIKDRVSRRPGLYTTESETDKLVWFTGDPDDGQFGIIVGSDGIVMTKTLMHELGDVINEMRRMEGWQ